VDPELAHDDRRKSQFHGGVQLKGFQASRPPASPAVAPEIAAFDWHGSQADSNVISDSRRALTMAFLTVLVVSGGTNSIAWERGF